MAHTLYHTEGFIIESVNSGYVINGPRLNPLAQILHPA